MITGWAARTRTAASSRPAERIRMTSPGSWPSTVSSRIGPDVTNVRPARTAAAHVSKLSGSSDSRWTYARTAPTGTSADILSVPATIGSR